MSDIPDAVAAGPEREQLWGRRLDERKLEVCCIPFFIYGVALGDIVEIDENSVLANVVEKAGRYVFRVWLGETVNPWREEVLEELSRLGCLTEFYSQNVIAVDAQDEPQAQTLANLLAGFSSRGILEYETGRL